MEESLKVLIEAITPYGTIVQTKSWRCVRDDLVELGFDALGDGTVGIGGVERSADVN